MHPRSESPMQVPHPSSAPGDRERPTDLVDALGFAEALGRLLGRHLGRQARPEAPARRQRARGEGLAENLGKS